MKIKKSHCAYLLIASCLGTLMGCQADMLYPTMGDVKAFAREERNEHRTHDKNMTEQHKVMHPDKAEEIQALRDVYLADMKKIEERTDLLQSNQVEQLKKLLTLAGKVLGIPDSIMNTILGDLGPKIAAAQKEADAAMSDAKNNAAVLKETKARLATCESALVALSKETSKKFALATDDTFARLDKVREDRAAFEEILRDELKLSPAQISDLKGMSTEQIMAMIAAAAGAAGIGVVGGRGGKSRSHEDVEKLKNKIAALTANIELHKTAPKG